MSTARSPHEGRGGKLSPAGVAMVSGVLGIVASVTAALISNAAGGPITVNVGQDPVAVAAPTPPPTTAQLLPPPGPPTQTLEQAQETLPPVFVQTLSFTDGRPSEVGGYAISGRRYDNSVKKTCVYSGSDPLGWPAAGYGRLTGIIGIADNERETAGISARVTIRNENGADLVAPFKVALGKPRSIDLPLNGAVQVQIDCTGVFPEGGAKWEFDATFADLALR